MKTAHETEKESRLASNCCGASFTVKVELEGSNGWQRHIICAKCCKECQPKEIKPQT